VARRHQHVRVKQGLSTTITGNNRIQHVHRYVSARVHSDGTEDVQCLFEASNNLLSLDYGLTWANAELRAAALCTGCQGRVLSRSPFGPRTSSE
jgi:hypothetical protein